jgi:LPS sulfotransferase NodH
MRYVYPRSEHEDALEQLFGVAAEVMPGANRLPCVLLGFVNRSGSNYLSELLQSTGRFGGFEESLNSYSLRYLAPRYDSRSFHDYLLRLRTEQVTGLGQMWGMRVGWQQIVLLLRTKAIPHLLQPTLVLIRRRDVVAQAVSYYIAEETGQWRSDIEAERPRSEVAYNGQAILRKLTSVLESYAYLSKVALLGGLPHLDVCYEDLVDAPTAVVSRLCERISGRGAVPHLRAIRTKMQRDELDETFKARFLDELGGLNWEPN